MKRIITILLLLIILISFADNLSVFVLSNPSSNVPDNFKTLIKINLQKEFSNKYSIVDESTIQNYIKKLKITYNYNDFSELLSKIPIPGFGLIFSIDNVIKEQKQEKLVYFYPSNQGNYVYIKGQYIKVRNKTLYSYDLENDSYKYDPKGTYIFYRYPWARNSKDEYFYTGGTFYSKNTKDILSQRCVLYASYRLVDFSKGTVVYSESLEKSSNTLSGLAEIRIELKNSKYYNEKPKILVYDFGNDFKESKFVSNKITSYIEDQKRFVAIDRKDFSKIIKNKKIQLAFSNFQSEFTELKIARYFIGIKLNYTNIEKVKETEPEYYANPFHGDYIDKTKVVVGEYYKKIGKNYVLDRKNGNYVKVVKGPWDKKDKYILFSTPYSMKIVQNTYYEAYANLSYVVYDGEDSEVVNLKNFELSSTLPFKVTDPQYGSVKSSYLSDVYNSLFNNIGEKVYSDLKRNFAIKADVIKSNGTNLVLDAGNNYGVDKNSIFNIYGEGNYFYAGKMVNYNFNIGFAKVLGVNEKTSYVRLDKLEKYSRFPKNGDYAIENFDYCPKSAFELGVSLLSFNNPTYEIFINFLQNNIYSETLSKINLFYISNNNFGARYFIKTIDNLYGGFGFIKSEKYGFGAMLSLTSGDLVFARANFEFFKNNKNVNFEMGVSIPGLCIR